jgi:Flp pilus assembly protein TadD
MGDHENALKYYRAAVELEPNWARAHRDLGVILALRGDWDQAIYESKKGMELSHRNPAHLADLGWIYGAAGKTSEAMAVIQEINERVRKERISPALSVKTWLGLGDHERALAALQQTADRETWPNSFLFLDERYAKFRQDLRVREEGQRIGLPCLECGLNSEQTKPSNAL